MIQQKNNKDPAASTVPPPLENEVDFELLWRCISKIWNQFGMATYLYEENSDENKIDLQLNCVCQRLSYNVCISC